MINKIVIIGPESTGKSTLCAQLAEHYNTSWVREYAREHLEKNGPAYAFEDLYTMAEGQISSENETVKDLEKNMESQLLFIDTDLYVIKVWSEFVFNKCDNRILTDIAKKKYDLYLLCDVDLPWVKDNLREYPDLETREKLFYYYKEEMTAQNVRWEIISGSYDERLQQAIGVVDKFFK